VSTAPNLVSTMRSEAAAWARGRNPWIRLPLLAWLAWVLRNHLADPDYSSIVDGLNLGIHELGHLVFAPLGDFAAAAGGTALQCMVPVIGAFMFWRQRDWFALAFAACWLGTNFFDIAPYAADARARAMPLVSPGAGEPIHDWYYMLAATGMLRQDTLIGAAFRGAGILAMLAGLLAGGWLLWVMVRSRGLAQRD